MNLRKKLMRAIGDEITVPNVNLAEKTEMGKKVGLAADFKLAQNIGLAADTELTSKSELAASDRLAEAISRVGTLSRKISDNIVSIVETAELIRAGKPTNTEFVPLSTEIGREGDESMEKLTEGFELARNVAAAANELGRQLNCKVVR